MLIRQLKQFTIFGQNLIKTPKKLTASINIICGFQKVQRIKSKPVQYVILFIYLHNYSRRYSIMRCMRIAWILAQGTALNTVHTWFLCV